MTNYIDIAAETEILNANKVAFDFVWRFLDHRAWLVEIFFNKNLQYHPGTVQEKLI